MNGVAADRHRSFLDGRNVGVSGVRKYDGGVGLLHDDLQVDVPLAEYCRVVLGRDLHRHEDRHCPRISSTPIVLNKVILKSRLDNVAYTKCIKI